MSWLSSMDAWIDFRGVRGLLGWMAVHMASASYRGNTTGIYLGSLDA